MRKKKCQNMNQSITEVDHYNQYADGKKQSTHMQFE